MHIPDGWSSLQILEILERVSDPIFPEPEEHYYQIGIRSHGKGLFHKESVTGEALGNKRVFRVHPDCFIVNIVFAWEQAVAKTSANETGMIASHRFPMFRPKNNLCNVDYLTYFFKAPKGKYLLGLASPGGAGRNKTLGQNEFSLLKISLPPTKEQQKIAQILSTWDKVIEKLEALIAAKQKRKKALMQQLLTGKMRFPSFLGVWKEITIAQFGKVVTGSTPLKLEVENYGNYVSWATAEDFNKKYVCDTVVKLSEIGASKARVVPKGSVLVTCIASIGKNAIASEDLATNQQINAVIVNPKNSNEFFYYLMEFYKHKLIAWAGITAVPILNKSSFEKIKFLIPLLEEQQKIAAVLAFADNEITIHQTQLAALKQQKTGLMQQLLTGKKRVQVDQAAA